MVSKVSPLVKYLENLREFAITFGLHQKKQTPVSFTFDRAISRIKDVYDFDCQCVNRVKAFLGTTAQTQGPQGTVSTVVLEDEKRILQALMDIKDLLSQHAYYTNAKSHYPRVKSDLRYSELPKMFPPSSAQLTKPQVQEMRDWRIKHGQSVPQKTVRNMSTKDNPGTLPINLYLTEQMLHLAK